MNKALDLEVEVLKQEQKITDFETAFRAAIMHGNATLVLDFLRMLCLNHGIQTIGLPTDAGVLGMNFTTKYLG